MATAQATLPQGSGYRIMEPRARIPVRLPSRWDRLNARLKESVPKPGHAPIWTKFLQRWTMVCQCAWRCESRRALVPSDLKGDPTKKIQQYLLKRDNDDQSELKAVCLIYARATGKDLAICGIEGCGLQGL